MKSENMANEAKEIIMGDKHVHEAGSVMFKFVQYSTGTAQKSPVKQGTDDEVEFVDLDFFDPKSFGTMAAQDQLRSILRSVLPKIDTDSGRDWVTLYIAYHYYIGKELMLRKYSDFFKDIEGLLPGVLNHVNVDATGDKRYKAYTDLLRLECANWFIDKGCLPPMRMWRSRQYDYKVDSERRNRIQAIVKEIYQGLKDIVP